MHVYLSGAIGQFSLCQTQCQMGDVILVRSPFYIYIIYIYVYSMFFLFFVLRPHNTFYCYQDTKLLVWHRGGSWKFGPSTSRGGSNICNVVYERVMIIRLLISNIAPREDKNEHSLTGTGANCFWAELPRVPRLVLNSLLTPKLAFLIWHSTFQLDFQLYIRPMNMHINK